MLLCLITSSERDAPFYRVPVAAGTGTGLRRSSRIMVDKIVATKRGTCGTVFGHLDLPTMRELNRTIMLVTGLADPAGMTGCQRRQIHPTRY